MAYIEIIEMIKVAGMISTFTVSVFGIYKTANVLKLKFEAELRLKNSFEIESEIKLLDLFSNVMDTAHARRGSHFSETIAKKISEDAKGVVPSYSAAMVSYPVGSASQDAAIAAIGELGLKHKILRNPALKGLLEIKKFKADIAIDYIQKLEEANK